MKFIETPKASKPIGPYSQGIIENGFVFVSGIIALDPASGNVVSGGVKEQTARVLESIKAILEQGGSSLQKVTRVTVYLKEASFFKEMNEVFIRYFGGHKPTRTTIVCSFIRDDLLVEMDAIAKT